MVRDAICAITEITPARHAQPSARQTLVKPISDGDTMTRTESRYDAISEMWTAVMVPPLTRIEAERAARRIFHHFGAIGLGGPHMIRSARFSGRVRRCWITRKTNAGLSKGWQRLVHDVSHRIFAQRHPNFRPHAGGHARLEHEIATYVITQGWLSGTLRPKVRSKPTTPERRAQAIERTESAITRWDSKLRRAQSALRKLRRRHRGQLCRLASASSSAHAART